MTSFRRVAALLAALAVVAPSVAAVAEPAPNARADAAVRFKKGLELFHDGDYQAALIEFRRAYELAPNYQVLYNIGQVSFQLQDYPGALSALTRYLAEGGRNIPPARRADVEHDIEKLKQRVATLEISVNVPDAEVVIDDVAVGKSPLKPVLVSAGKHRVAVAKSGFSSGNKIVEIASQETQKLSFELTDTSPAAPPATLNPEPQTTEPQRAPPPAAPDTAHSGGSMTGAVIGFSATGALTVGAVLTGIMALGASSDLQTLRDHAGDTRASLDAAASKTSHLALVTDILGGCAIAGAGLSIYLTVAARSSSNGADAPAATAPRVVRLGVLPGGLTLGGSF